MSSTPPYAHRADFQSYLGLVEEDLRQARSAASQHTKLDALEQLMLKLAFVLHDGTRAGFRDAPVGECVRVLVAKMMNEVFSFIACARAGSLSGAWHHARALIEIRAALHYIFDDASRTTLRIEQFCDYQKLLTWQTRRDMERQVKEGTMTEAVMKERVSDATMAELEKRVPRWITLFASKNPDKLDKRKHWHNEHLQVLIDALGPDVSRNYTMLCHPTHVSPVGHLLSVKGEPQGLGFDLPQLSAGVQYAAQSVIESVLIIDKTGAIVFLDNQLGHSLEEHLEEQIAALLPHDLLAQSPLEGPTT